MSYTAWQVSWDSPIASASSARLNLNSDGSASQSGSSFNNSTPGSNWFSSVVAGIGSAYWVKATLTAGVNPDVGTIGAVVSLSAGQSWYQNASTTNKSSTFTLDFYADAAGTVLIKSVPGNIVERTHS